MRNEQNLQEWLEYTPRFNSEHLSPNTSRLCKWLHSKTGDDVIKQMKTMCSKTVVANIHYMKSVHSDCPKSAIRIVSRLQKSGKWLCSVFQPLLIQLTVYSRISLSHTLTISFKDTGNVMLTWL